MKTAILSVGTEILFGQIVNTNTVYLSQQLNMLGFDVMYHYTVGDNTTRLKEMIEYIFHDCDLIITTGGLGPTQDDLTKETVCEALNDKLVENAAAMHNLKAHFQHSVMTENNLKQAYLPSRAVMFRNDTGTAPGFALEDNGKMVICMPGPPKEMTKMFEGYVRPFLEKMQDSVIFYKTVRTIGSEESRMETELLDLIDTQTDPTLATYAKETGCTVRIASKRKTIEEAEAAVDEMVEKVLDRIGDYVYSTDDEDIEQVIAKKLLEKGVTISSAESCTAGLFSATLANVPGISKVFERGIATYSNQAKIDELGVKQETLEKYGAVSAETALEMAKGLAEKTGSDICLSVTGIAGPDGGTSEKPVGLIYVAANYSDKAAGKSGSDRNETVIEYKRNTANRDWNRRFSVLRMMELANKILDGKIEIK